jgi:hypothetical protein
MGVSDDLLIYEIILGYQKGNLHTTCTHSWLSHGHRRFSFISYGCINTGLRAGLEAAAGAKRCSQGLYSSSFGEELGGRESAAVMIRWSCNDRKAIGKATNGYDLGSDVHAEQLSIKIPLT